MLRNTSKGHKTQANPTCDPGHKYNFSNHKSTTSYDRHTKSGLQLPPFLLTLLNQHTTATHPAPSPTHYHTPPLMRYLTTHQTTVPLYPNNPRHHAIPYTTSSSSTPTQSLHLPQTSALSLQTHYHPFPTILLNLTPHTSIPRMGTSEQYKGAQLRMTIIFFYEK